MAAKTTAERVAAYRRRQKERLVAAEAAVASLNAELAAARAELATLRDQLAAETSATAAAADLNRLSRCAANPAVQGGEDVNERSAGRTASQDRVPLDRQAATDTDIRITSTRSPAVAMQAIADAARHHQYYVQAAPLKDDALDRIVEKMTARYPDLLLNKYAAYRRRKAGKPVHYLVILRPGPRSSGGFWLLATEPDPAEKWQLVTDRHNRLTLYWWQLVRHTRAGQATPAWTWRMKPDIKESLEAKITEAVTKNLDTWLERFIWRSRRWPGFAGIRQDHAELMRFIEDRWIQVRGSSMPWKLPWLPYLPRIQHKKTKMDNGANI